ncbi:MAG: cell division protein FtsA [Acidobacteria bacterium]|nr:MAG: cell division protein FtsA [Acidobacteriota bacterium]
MGKRNENIITVIDLGSAKTLALVVEATNAGLRYRGHGISPSAGTRRGVIVDLESAGKSVAEAVARAEKSSGIALDSAVVGVSGPHIRSGNSYGVISLGSRARELTTADVQAAGARARDIEMPEDREILHLLTQEFVVDDQDGVKQPVGMLARQLEVRVHVITAAHSAVQNIVTSLNRVGMHVEDTIYEALACSESVLRGEERELGAAVIDIGAGTADIAVVRDDVVIHSGVVPLGGLNFTRDVAYGLETPVAEAENLKRQFGCSIVTNISEQNEIEVPSVGDRPPRMMRQRDLAEILEPRARELMELLRDDLHRAGVLEKLGGGIILTGGAARLPSLLDTCEDILRRPARLGLPLGMAQLPVELQEPEYAAAIGMVFYTQRARVLKRKEKEETGFGARVRALFVRGNAG